MTKFKTQLLLTGCVLCVASSGIANEKAVANEYFDGSTLAFEYKGNYSNATISVSGPNGFNTKVFQKRGQPTIDLSQKKALASKGASSSLPNVSSLEDGLYNYEITVATDKKVKVNDNGDNGRSNNAKTMMNVGESQSGSFRVLNGSIVTELDVKEEK